MPHVIVKARPGKTEEQKQQLADAITRDVMSILGYGEESVSVAFEEVEASRWKDDVYVPDILGCPDLLVQKPGYRM
ncbi:4-oxalocrotonate tautomerase [Paraburkholderia youngii]|uniref:4-oxalocrotonate tautomerase n=1 Tax=Paraburkholderia youngii TaxID=2782701 RepID=A0A7W8P0G7_9BURK|nr:tautomerase family protein [Paraburkholderia youngii]MBB5399061.1 4-oxalocrotonate tautomerase [Paraburkholderia youngii]NUX56172.1 4-oxalocrotonate tautomerase [Paraburkholderia youngii]NVI08358.1 4-oxalocrotonate tautomerase [Paraburkholderia youngii]